MSDLDTLFASRSVPEHLVRGAVGLPLLVAAFALVPWWGPLALLLALPAGVLLRGCPGCWAMGLSQTCALRDARSAGSTAGTTPESPAEPGVGSERHPVAG